MLEKITSISAIKQIQTKNGLSDKITIQTAEHGEKYLGVWLDDASRNWRVGDTVDITTSENGKYTNAYPVKDQAPFNTGSYTPPFTPATSAMPKPAQFVPEETMPWDPTLENIMRGISEIRRDVAEIKAKIGG